MQAEDFLNDDFLKQFKDGKDFMSFMDQMYKRGVEKMYILITCKDNLGGFTQTIRSVFPEATTQICVVHQIRNACKYVVWKDKKSFTQKMKPVYSAL